VCGIQCGDVAMFLEDIQSGVKEIYEG